VPGRPERDASAAAAPIGRRAFIGIIATGATSVVWGAPVYEALSQAVRPIIGLLPQGVRATFPSPDTGWRIYSVNPPYPTFDPVSWRLRIDGLVAAPQSYSLGALRALPRAEQVSDFHCVTGWSVPRVHWAGVRFADLLEAARPLPQGRALNFISAEEPYADSLTLAQAMLSDAMLAYEMDGKPLAREHGAPVRLVMPRMYGYKGTKWVRRITLTERPVPGFWEQRNYDQDAWVGRSNGY
jgi:DMSO/TMAO reductase YedYZ molybdopterin-dependent catalytic subunit